MAAAPMEEGFYWAQWRIADDGTQDGDEVPPIGTWEVVEVYENGHRGEPDHLRVFVLGISKSQSLENFVWGAGPLVRQEVEP